MNSPVANRSRRRYKAIGIVLLVLWYAGVWSGLAIGPEHPWTRLAAAAAALAGMALLVAGAGDRPQP